MENYVQDQIVQFNRTFKRYDDIYRREARNFDMPELALWILYVLREKPECTQKDLVDMQVVWQTANLWLYRRVSNLYSITVKLTVL